MELNFNADDEKNDDCLSTSCGGTLSGLKIFISISHVTQIKTTSKQGEPCFVKSSSLRVAMACANSSQKTTRIMK